MSDGAISQDEIDALLSGVDMGGLSGGSSSSSSVDIDTGVLTQFATGIKDRLASNIGSMTGVSASAGSVSVESVNRDKFLSVLPEEVVAVMADFSTGLQGDHLYVLSTDFAKKLVGLINKEDNVELDDMALSVITEVVSQHTGAEITDLTKNGSFPGLACNPGESIHCPKAMVRFPQGSFALFSYTVILDGTSYVMWEAVSGSVAEQMAVALGGQKQAAASQPMQTMGNMNMSMGQPAGMMNTNAMNMNPVMGGGMNMNGMGNGFVSSPMGMGAPNVQSLQFPGLQSGVSTVEQGNIGLIMDVYMEMTVELGRTKKQIKEILGMGEGTIIELDKLAGEPVDILVNHKPIAKGEVVVIDENFGVRVTEILSPLERVSG